MISFRPQSKANNPDQILASGNIISDLSAHFSHFRVATSTKDKHQAKSFTKTRDFSRFHDDHFISDLSGVQWDETNDVIKCFSSCYNKFNKIVNKHGPSEKLSNRKAKQFPTPWITAGLKTSIRFKYNLYTSDDEAISTNIIQTKFVA